MKNIIFATLAMLFATSLTAKEQGASVNVDATYLAGFISALRVSESELIQQGTDTRKHNAQSAFVERAIKTRIGDRIASAPSPVCLPEGASEAQLIDDVLQQLPDIAADSTQSRADQVITAIRNTYPC